MINKLCSHLSFQGFIKHDTLAVSLWQKNHPMTKYKYLAVLFVLAKVIAACYIYLKYGSIFSSAVEHNFSTEHHVSSSCSEKRTEAVILFTQMRSGSSFVGEIFNQRNDVAYFYEPLFPFPGRSCSSLHQEKMQVLGNITQCYLGNLSKLYQKAFKVSKYNERPGCCKEHYTCFAQNNGKAGRYFFRDAGICEEQPKGGQICPKPIDLTMLSKHCKQSLIRALKVIYLCKLEWLVQLLESQDVNVKVVHLVRDPRATINSRLGYSRKSVKATRKSVHRVCEQLTTNVFYANKVLRHSPLSEKYMRIRHEDFSLDPLGMTQKIYDFIGINMSPSMREWLIKASSSSNDRELSKTQKQATKGNLASVVSAWRKSLSMEEVQEIQNECKEALKILKYRTYNTENELHNLSQLHFYT